MTEIFVTLQDKVVDGKLYVDQELLPVAEAVDLKAFCAAADILEGTHWCRCLQLKRISGDTDLWNLQIVSSQIFLQQEQLEEAHPVELRGAGDTPANNAFSIRHTTRNFPNRGSSQDSERQIPLLLRRAPLQLQQQIKGSSPSAEEYTGDYTNHKFFSSIKHFTIVHRQQRCGRSVC